MELKATMPGEGDGVKEGEMLGIKRGDLNYNLNTYLLIFTFLSGVTWAITQWTDQKTADKNTQDWITRHEAQHRERQAAYEGTIATFRSELGQVREETRKLENLNYRITVAEQAAINIQKTLENLSNAVSILAADVRVTRTIIEAEGVEPNTPARRRARRVDN